MRTLAILLLSALPALALDLTGVWVGQLPGRNGQSRDMAFQFIQKGNTLTGKQYGDYQSSRIVEGKVTDGEVMFIVVSQEQNGNQIDDTKIRFTGCMQNGELELSRERESATNAGNGGVVAIKGATTQSFRLKRLYH